jgi:hypothetical protein
MAGRSLNCPKIHVITKVKQTDMADRSYAQIRWQQERFGLLLVNSRNEKFFLYADKLQKLFDRDDEYVVLKLRDRKPSRAIGYYPGQVIGTLDKTAEKISICLYISEPYSDVKFLNDGGAVTPDEFHVEQLFTFPLKEFMRFKTIIDTMLEQAQFFSEQLRAAEMTPLSLKKDSSRVL